MKSLHLPAVFSSALIHEEILPQKQLLKALKNNHDYQLQNGNIQRSELYNLNSLV